MKNSGEKYKLCGDLLIKKKKNPKFSLDKLVRMVLQIAKCHGLGVSKCYSVEGQIMNQLGRSCGLAMLQ